jgi:hypothetical protein
MLCFCRKHRSAPAVSSWSWLPKHHYQLFVVRFEFYFNSQKSPYNSRNFIKSCMSSLFWNSLLWIRYFAHISWDSCVTVKMIFMHLLWHFFILWMVFQVSTIYNSNIGCQSVVKCNESAVLSLVISDQILKAPLDILWVICSSLLRRKCASKLPNFVQQIWTVLETRSVS